MEKVSYIAGKQKILSCILCGTPKQILVRLEAENVSLRAQVAGLQCELEAIRGK